MEQRLRATDQPKQRDGLPLLRRVRLDGTAKVWLLNVGLAAVATLIYVLFVRDLTSLAHPMHIPWPLLAAGFYFAEVYVVHLQVRRDAHSFSLSEIPLVLGLFFSSPSELVLAQLVGAAIALAFVRRQSPLKFAFNLGHFCLEASLAAVLFHSVVNADAFTLGWRAWAGTFLATLATTVVGALTITLAISLSEAKWRLKTLPQGLGIGTLMTMSNSCLALVGATILWLNPGSAWLLLVPIATLFFAYRAYTSERQKHHTLESLYETTRVAHGSLQVQEAMHSLLSQTRKMFRAEIAQITLFTTEAGQTPMRTTLGPGDEFDFMRPIELDPTQGVWARVASEEHAVLVARPIVNEPLRLHFAERGMRDAMVAPLYGDEKVAGVMTVGNRLGDVSTFDDEDLKLFETLANHASVSLQNARLVARLEESLAHLTEMNRLKDDFVASVSHELRTPLTSIQGYVKTLLRPDVDFDRDQQHAFLQTIERQGTRLHRLIEDLLVVARIEEQQVAPVLDEVAMPELAGRVVEELRSRASSWTIEVDLDPALPTVTTDEGKVHQILSNLVDNALKYSEPGSTVRIGGAVVGDGVGITVHDQGAGVPLELQDRVFDRFYQVDQSSTRRVGGAGLGLYICRRLAEAVGGRVWLERSTAEGSVFGLWVPLSPSLPALHPTELGHGARPLPTH
ncbi:MAG TPA: ATP-binding protein [Actinomycetota bacterium]|jgi:signal transduction histidine kinase